MKSWPAVAAGRQSSEALIDYLRPFCTATPAPMFEAPPEAGARLFYNDALDGFTFERRSSPLAHLLDRLREPSERAAATLYAGSLPIGAFLPAFGRENPLPELFRTDQVLESIWIGNRSRVAPHYDQTENIACVVGGARRFTCFPTDQFANLYPGPIDFTPAGQPVSLVDPEAPDLDRFPRYAEAMETALAAELAPGDAIYIPSLWWHGVDAIGEVNVLVNYWWREIPSWAESPANTLLHALLTLKPLPPAERARWRSLFEALVFETEEPALAHLAPERRGVFGELTAERAEQIRAFLAKSLANPRR